MALLHSPQDQFTATETNVDALTIADRKVGQKNLHIVAFVGVPPPPAPWRWLALQLHGGLERSLLTDLILDARGYAGQIAFVLPPDLKIRGGIEKALHGFKVEHRGRAPDIIEDWRERQDLELRKLIAHGRYSHAKSKAMIEALVGISNASLLVAEPRHRGRTARPGARSKAILHRIPRD